MIFQNVTFGTIAKRVWPLAAALLVGACVGWGIKPDAVRVEEKTKIVEKQVTTEAQKELLKSFEDLRVELQRVRETQVTEKYHREELETRLADGTYTRRVTVDKNIDSHTRETETKVEVKVVEVEKKVETVRTEFVNRTVEVEKKVEPVLAQWHVGVFGGVNPRLLPSPQATGWIVGGEIERRIVGPFFLGVWAAGITTGQGMGGIKVGVEF